MFKKITNHHEAYVNSLILAITTDDDEKLSKALEMAKSFENELSSSQIQLAKSLTKMTIQNEKYVLMNEHDEIFVLSVDDDFRLMIEFEDCSFTTDNPLAGLNEILIEISENKLTNLGLE